MSVPSVTLKGTAVAGIDPGLVRPFNPGRYAAPNPVVKLGRRPPKPTPGPIRKLAREDIIRHRRMMPGVTDWRALAGRSIGQTYGNTQQGDCVVAAKMHAVGVWTANAVGGPGEAVGSDVEALRTYHLIGGPGDDGLVMTDALDWMKTRGVSVGGRMFKIEDYAAVDWTVKDLAMASINDLGGFDIGINLPGDWTENAVWDVTDSDIVGGHDVWCCDYDSQGVYVASWGRLYLVTWRAFTSRTWLEEAYAVLAPAWLQPTGLAPSGFDHNTAGAALLLLSQGSVPPDPVPPSPPPPSPPPPPPPPPPVPVPAGGYDIAMSWEYAGATGTMAGTVKPHAQAGADLDTVTVQCGDEAVASLVNDLLFALEGVASTRRGSSVTVSRLGLSPEQWQELVAAILAVIRVFLG